MLGLVDTALMGHLESEVYLDAIALGGAIFSFLYWGLGFLRMGTTGLTAQKYGAQDTNETSAILFRGLGIAFALAFVLIIIQYPVSEFGFMMMEGSENIKVIGKEYFAIRIWAAPAALGLLVYHGWFLGLQNARYPLFLTILGNVLNIGFNCWFLFGFDMKADGIAYGTVIAQYSSFIAAVILFEWKYRKSFPFAGWRKVFKKGAIRSFLLLNSDIFIRTLCIIFVLNFIVALSGNFGDEMIAVNSILLQLNYLMAYGIDGFAYAGESLVGLMKGNKQQDQLRGVIKWLFIWGMGISAVFSLLYVVAGEWMFRIMTDLPQVLAILPEYQYWLAALPLAGGAAFIWDGIYLGATASRPLRDSLLISTLLIFLPAWYLTLSWDNHGMWFAMILFMVSRTVLLTVLAKKHILNG